MPGEVSVRPNGQANLAYAVPRLLRLPTKRGRGCLEAFLEHLGKA